ncbi:hypothetical protein H4R24_005634 [Coemansia sp. RSA 988]|nr:hypothetical protein H4R24_005634 [Coemansia sp. RSA 988]
MDQGPHQHDPPGGDGSATADRGDARSLTGTPREQEGMAWMDGHPLPGSQPLQQAEIPAVPGTSTVRATDQPSEEEDQMDADSASAEEDKDSETELEEALMLRQAMAMEITEMAHAWFPRLKRGEDLEEMMADLVESFLLKGANTVKERRAEMAFQKAWRELEAGQAEEKALAEKVEEVAAHLNKLREAAAKKASKVVEKRATAEAALTVLDETLGFSSENKFCKQVAELRLAEKEVELQKAKKQQQQGGPRGPLSYAQMAGRRGAGGAIWMAPPRGVPKKAPMARKPFPRDREAAEKRTPAPKWVKDSGQQAALLTFTGLAGRGLSQSKLSQAIKEMVHHTCVVKRILQNANTAQLVVRVENWGLVVEALKKQCLVPLPDLQPWECIPHGTQVQKEAYQQTREQWGSQERMANIGITGLVAKWILEGIPSGEQADKIPRKAHTPAALLEEGQIEEQGEEPGFAAQQLGRWQCAGTAQATLGKQATEGIAHPNSFAVLQEEEDTWMEEDKPERGPPKCTRDEVDMDRLEEDREPLYTKLNNEEDSSTFAGPSTAVRDQSEDHRPGLQEANAPQGSRN